jgi:hypothetical protein
MVRFEFESEIVSFCFSFIFISFRESLFLVSWCAGGKCGMACSGLVQRTGDGRAGRVLGGRAIERSGRAVCDLHRARGDEERGFLG